MMAEGFRSWRHYSRQNRFLLAAFFFLLVLSVAAVYLLQKTQTASPTELTNRLLLFVLWYLDISLILVLSFILVRSVFKLAIERRAGVLGSRFRTKLVLTYVGLSFVPMIFIFLIATNFLQRSIDRWFSSPVEDVLRGGVEVTVQLRELLEDRLQRQSEIAAMELARNPRTEHIEELQQVMGVDLLALYQGPRLLQAVTNVRLIPRSVPPLRWSSLPETGTRAERWNNGGLLLRAWTPVGTGNQMVVVGTMIPRDLVINLDRATAAHTTFQEMKIQRGTVTSTTVLVFLAITLLVLFATVWIGLYLSRRFTEPLLAVAAATQRVAEGEQLEEVEVTATDEVGVLVNSFNSMVRRVRNTEEEIRASHQDLATLLATIPTGVLTVSPDGRRFRPNRAAATMLGEPSWVGTWRSLEQLNRPGLTRFHERLLPGQPDDCSFQTDIEPDHNTRHVEVTLTPLPGGGAVVAMDDLTQLIRAQRQAAWSEVAQRIAHEIRNPLTPIRLAAERIQKRATAIDGELREIVSSGCEAIVAHVSGLKELVDSFYQYARMPSVEPTLSSVTKLVRDVTSLYEELRSGLDLRVDMPSSTLEAMVDPVFLRQALVNLLDNAAESISGEGFITITVAAHGRDLILEVLDTGDGLPTEDMEKLTEPFFSTKGRGSGMGLALVHRIVADHGGTLEIRNQDPHGALVRITLPGALSDAD